MKIKLIFAVLLMPVLTSLSYATPSLGVVAFTDCQYAYNTVPDDKSGITYFADNVFPSVNKREGFVIEGSGAEMIVFTTYNPASTDIYLMTNLDAANLPILYGTSSLSAMTFSKKIKGYQSSTLTYYGCLLQKDMSFWSIIDNKDGYFEDNTTFYYFKAPLIYSGTLTTDDHFFAIAYEKNNKCAKMSVSPQTYSSVGGYNPVPEPGSLMMLGTGFLGLIGLISFKNRFPR